MCPEIHEQMYAHVQLHEMESVAVSLLREASSYKVWIFFGDMGAGKTTLIKFLCKALGVEDTMSSPTFSIVNEYLARDQQHVFHFDFYRIKNEGEAWDMGLEEYFYSGNYCFVEWPEKIPSLIPVRHATVTITTENNTQRTIALSVHDGEKENRL